MGFLIVWLSEEFLRLGNDAEYRGAEKYTQLICNEHVAYFYRALKSIGVKWNFAKNGKSSKNYFLLTDWNGVRSDFPSNHQLRISRFSLEFRVYAAGAENDRLKAELETGNPLRINDQNP